MSAPYQRTAQRVPNADVATLKAGWESEGATVTVKDNGDGTSDVTGVWPAATGSGTSGATSG